MIVRCTHVEKKGRNKEGTQSPHFVRQQMSDFFFFFSQIMIWNIDTREAVILNPVKILDAHKDVILSMSFNTDGSLLATACRDRKIRVIEPRSGTVLQVGGTQWFVVQLISPVDCFLFWVDSLPLEKTDLCPVLSETSESRIVFYFSWKNCCCWQQVLCILLTSSSLPKTLPEVHCFHSSLLQSSRGTAVGFLRVSSRDQVARWMQVYICLYFAFLGKVMLTAFWRYVHTFVYLCTQKGQQYHS